MLYPAELRYSKSHEWVKTEDGVTVVGISDFAQNALGDVVFVNLPEEGDSVTAGENFGDVESVKAVSDLVSPITGTVCAVNEELLDSPELVNSDPYGAWLIKVENVEGSEELLQRTALSRENLTTHLEDDSLIALIEETTQELNRPLPNPDLYSLSQLIRMLKILADQVRVDVDTDKASMRSYVQQVLDFIHFNYAEPITVQEMAGLLSLNRSYLYRIFKEETGLSPIEYLNGYRIDRARQLLVETNIPVGQISVSTGFSTFSSFSRFFRLKYGVSPSTFRKMARTGKAGSVPLLGTD